MTHGYSLRPNAKGRRVHQSIDDPDNDQVEGSSNSTSKGHLTDESGAVDLDLGPTTSYAAQHWERGITSSSIASCTTPQHQQHMHTDKLGGSATTRYRRVRVGNTPGTETETLDEIRAGRKREEARRLAEAVRIRREQVVRGFEEEICALRARIGALREECEVRVARVRRGWERAAIERRGEVMVDADSDLDADGEMDVENNYAPTETSTTDNGDDDEQWQQQWPSQSPPPHWSRFETLSPPPPLLQRQQQQAHVRMGISPSSGVGPSRLQPEAMEENEETHSQQSQGRPQPQPLRRQPAQLMAIPISSLGLHAYATAALVPENCLRDMDKDSEMGE